MVHDQGTCPGSFEVPIYDLREASGNGLQLTGSDQKCSVDAVVNEKKDEARHQPLVIYIYR